MVTPPVSFGVLATLVVIGVFAIALLEFNALSYAYRRIGVSVHWMLVILAVALLGSAVNIPVATLHSRVVEGSAIVRVFGVTYRVPARIREGATVVAVNVGGAVVPVALAGYLIVHDGLGMGVVWASLVVTVVVFAVARPVPGVGIVIPALLPPAVAALAAVLLGGSSVAAVAFVAGTLGTLVGADVLNLPRVRGLGAPLVAIGGAGTFDGVFLVGVFAVLLATL